VIILSSNFRRNIDEAFMRRFQSVVAFAIPQPAERIRLWREAMPKAARLDEELDLDALAEQHDISGGTIMNVVRYAALRSLVRGDACIVAEDVGDGLRRELLKEGRGL
jgi:SpoVK/Ycf46/Vps4 family AAA+-type ATPase